MKSTFKNGANLIILDSKNSIYTQVANYGEKKRMLPGGGIEKLETPRIAAARETKEESGLDVDPSFFEHCATFTQRPYGLVCLYVVDQYKGQMLQEGDNEIQSREFMSLQQIIDRKDEFYLGYIRMIAYYYIWKYVLKKKQTIECPLANPVRFQINLLE